MEPSAKPKKRGWIFLALWAIFICAGIIAKRIYFHPDMMVFYHLPAAVFLVLAGYELSLPVRNRYQETLRERTKIR